jgi:tetratricopeptide (TPR) repeat protein
MEIDVLSALQQAMLLLGRLKEAERHCTRVLELVRGDVEYTNFTGASSRIASLALRGMARAELGLVAKASDDVELALRTADLHGTDERGADENRLLALRAAVHSAALCGTAPASLPRARRLAQLALRSGSPLWTLDASLCTGIAHVDAEQFGDAAAPLEQVIERIDERGFAKHDLGRALTALARAYLGAGRASDAVEIAERAVRTCRSAGMKSLECAARLVLARAWLAAEGPSARRKIRAGLARAEQLVKETGARGYRPFMDEIRAGLAQS